MKRALSAILALVMAGSIFFGCGNVCFAAQAGKCGEHVSYSFEQSSGLLTISGRGATYSMEDLDRESPFTGDSLGAVKAIVFEEGVTAVGENLFESMPYLQSVTFCAGLETIGAYAFYQCPAIERVVLPEGVRSIEECAFSGCIALKTLVLPASLSEIGEEAFFGCTALSALVIPARVSRIGEDAFADCKGLESIRVEEQNRVYDSRDACQAIVQTKTDTILLGCRNTVIPVTVGTIGKHAFAGLSTLYIPAGIREIYREAFFYCNALESIQVDESNPYYDSRNDCNAIIQTAQNSMIQGSAGTIVPDTVTRVDGFCGNTKLQSLYIPNSVKEVGSFMNCSSLQKIVLPDSLSAIDCYMFANCISLQNLTIPAKVTVIHEGAFDGCKALEYIICTLSLKKIDPHTFAHCTAFKKLYYQGSAAQWKAVKIGASNTVLASAKIHFYYNADRIAAFKCLARTSAAQTIGWNKVAGADGYQVKMSSKDGNRWETYATVTTTSYTFKQLAAANMYKFKVRYFRYVNGKRVYGEWTDTLRSPTLPRTIAISKLTAGSKSFSAQWNQRIVTGYQLQYSTNAQFSGAKLITVRNPKQVKLTVKQLSAKKVYYIRVRTYKEIAKENYFSVWSDTYKVKTK